MKKWLAAVAVLTPLSVLSAPPGVLWSSEGDIGLISSRTQRLAVDSAGNAFVVGRGGSVEGGFCMEIRKQSVVDGSLMWERQVCAADATTSGLAVAVDAMGNAVITGSVANDIRTVKYSSDGQVIWDKTFAAPGNGFDEGRAVHVLSNGDVVVTGVAWGGRARDGEVLRYRGTDGQLLWGTAIDHGEDDDFYASAVADDGTIALATRTSMRSGVDLFWGIAKIRPDGSIMWRKVLTDIVKGAPSAIVMDQEGDVYVAGVSKPRSEFETDRAVYKLGTDDGSVIWRRYWDEIGNEFASAMRIHGDGSLFLVGGSVGKAFTARLSAASGSTIWESHWGLPDGELELGADFALADDGDIVVIGSGFHDAVNLMRVTKYSREDGHRVWMRRFDTARGGTGINVISRGSSLYLLGGVGTVTGGTMHLVRLDDSVASIPPNVQGLWYNAPAESESGWGINLIQQGDTIFATWFTYGENGEPLWLVGSNVPKTDDAMYQGALYTTTGPAFNAVPFDPVQVKNTEVGWISVEFEDANNGVLHYRYGGRLSSHPITRQVYALPLPTCAVSTEGRGPNYQDLWWAAPAGIESGWGINLTHQQDIIFATWFTYGADGKPLWLVGSDVRRVPGTPHFAGKLYRTRGTWFLNPFDSSRFSIREVGTMALDFSSPDSATFQYTVDGVSQSKEIARQVYALPTTVCH
jgi:hypothetical protein